ncbi:hypothetical protein E4U42_003592 [Claviceps africana]|uniref:Flap structure-specific endonuclease n=1 Tax=Claviceps africana TaxID=83212 RepID=A0A8K0JCK2_9HYPO|nr:hypothetical protein E4U42_003592 [Claviceps africana]
MGIKGIYPELGPCRRISLSKLAGECLESNKRPYRIAIDIAIWHFQNQAARGGTNPAIRTLFYRLVRLLAIPIQPVFVFDGPHKPVFKRNKRSGRGDGVAIAMAKRLIRLFGFPAHDAPGEAEAECALLQRHGIVDAVLSEDVDTIMFGCTKTLRNWSAESKNANTPTHVSLYDVYDMNLGDIGLDREGMVLVALMSGGDYLPDGIPGCGVKVACEAAKAGFGKSVCRLKASDKAGILDWRRRLIHELQTNEQKFFRTKHKKLVIPDDFPNIEVLRYYTHPVVSPESSLQDIKQKVVRKSDIQLEALREFTRETFDWDYRIGAIKFVRVLGQALLVQKIAEEAEAAAQHILRISGRRTHFSTDSMPELRVSYIPEEVVPIDVSNEVDEVIQHDRGALALNSDEEFEMLPGAVEETAKIFDITKPDLAWVLEGLVKTCTPSVFEQWQDKQRAKAVKTSVTRKTTKKKMNEPSVTKSAKAAPDMPRGALDQYVKTTKASCASRNTLPKMPHEASWSPPPISAPLPNNPALRPPCRLLACASPSKQPSPWSWPSPLSSPSSSRPFSSTTKSKRPVKKASSALQVIDSSPTYTPRSSQTQKLPEAIYISSSPPAALTSSPPASPSPRRPSSVATASLFSPTDKVSGTVRSDSQDNRPRGPKALKGSPKRALRQRHGFLGSTSPKSPVLKQSSMDMFVKKSHKPSATAAAAAAAAAESGPAGPGPGQTVLLDGTDDHDDGDSDLEPLPARMQLTSASSAKGASSFQATSTTLARDQIEEASRAESSLKKKLLRPRASAPGFYEEIELSDEERDVQLAAAAAAAAAAGSSSRASRASRAIRWSDVSVVDLT